MICSWVVVCTQSVLLTGEHSCHCHSSFSLMQRSHALCSGLYLSTYVWENNLSPNRNIKWPIIKKCQRYKPEQKACDLCEKLEIVKTLNKENNLNKRTDIKNKCTLHTNSRTLKFYECPDKLACYNTTPCLEKLHSDSGKCVYQSTTHCLHTRQHSFKSNRMIR